MKPVRFTDTVRRFVLPYVPAAESEKIGYLDARFALYRAAQEKVAAERRDKLRQIKVKP